MPPSGNNPPPTAMTSSETSPLFSYDIIAPTTPSTMLGGFVGTFGNFQAQSINAVPIYNANPTQGTSTFEILIYTLPMLGFHHHNPRKDCQYTNSQNFINAEVFTTPLVPYQTTTTTTTGASTIGGAFFYIRIRLHATNNSFIFTNDFSHD